EVSTQRHGEVARRHAVGSLFDLPYDAGPSAQRQQLGAQIVRPFLVRDAELRERVRDRRQRIASGGTVLVDARRERSGPVATLRRERRGVELQEAAVNPAAS